MNCDLGDRRWISWAAAEGLNPPNGEIYMNGRRTSDARKEEREKMRLSGAPNERTAIVDCRKVID
jgi:hypothetical protein